MKMSKDKKKTILKIILQVAILLTLIAITGFLYWLTDGSYVVTE